jgi:hypothetical protein
MTTTSTLAELLRETEPYTQDDAHWFEESAKRLEEQEIAINQLKADLVFQGNKVAELTRDSIAFHDFFYKHDPMGYQAFYARNVS